MTHDVQSPLSPIGILANHSYKRDIFPLTFDFFYSDVIKTKFLFRRFVSQEAKKVYVRFVDPSVLAFSLSSHRLSYYKFFYLAFALSIHEKHSNSKKKRFSVNRRN